MTKKCQSERKKYRTVRDVLVLCTYCVGVERRATQKLNLKSWAVDEALSIRNSSR